MSADIQKLALDVLAACEGDGSMLAVLRSRFGGPALTAEKLRSRVLEKLGRAQGPLTIADVLKFLHQTFPNGAERYRVDRKSNTIIPGRLIEEADWDSVFDAMRDSGVTRLNGGERMTDTALQRLAARRDVAVTALDIAGWNGRITDAGLSAIEAMPALRDIQLCWQQHITDAGLGALQACEQIEIVNLMGTNSGDGVLRALAGKPQLRKLSMGREMTDAGIPLLHDVPQFKNWRGGELRYGLMDFDAEPTYLLLDGALSDAGIGALTGLDGLFGLNFFWHCDGLTERSFSHLQGLANLGFLGADGKLCTDESFGRISEIPRLRMLMAQGAVASAAGFRNLSRSQTLEYIWGRDCPGFDGDALRALSRMPALRGFAISCRNVGDDALATLPDFPALTDLMPMDVSDAGFQHVGRCENLEGLWCMYCRETGDAATEHIAGLRKLKRYYAGKTRITDRSLEILSEMETLERIELWGCEGIGDAGVAKLATLPRLKAVMVHDSPGVTGAIEGMFGAGVTVDYLRR